MPTTVIKIGGNELDKPAFVKQAAEAIAKLQREQACIVVHGGGAAISRMLERLGIKPQFKENGQRLTDDDTMEVVEFILSGHVNKFLVTALLEAGVDAMGLSGVDRRLLWAEPFAADLDWVGRVVDVRTEVLTDLLDKGVVPVVAPPSNGDAGRYNVNADVAAGAISGALQADKVIFVTNVPGVKVDGEVATLLTEAEVQSLVQQGVIYGGMIPKTEAALSALAQGAQSAVITNLDGLTAGTGTVLINGKKT